MLVQFEVWSELNFLKIPYNPQSAICDLLSASFLLLSTMHYTSLPLSLLTVSLLFFPLLPWPPADVFRDVLELLILACEPVKFSRTFAGRLWSVSVVWKGPQWEDLHHWNQQMLRIGVVWGGVFSLFSGVWGETWLLNIYQCITGCFLALPIQTWLSWFFLPPLHDHPPSFCPSLAFPPLLSFHPR